MSGSRGELDPACGGRGCRPRHSRVKLAVWHGSRGMRAFTSRDFPTPDGRPVSSQWTPLKLREFRIASIDDKLTFYGSSSYKRDIRRVAPRLRGLLGLLIHNDQGS